MKISQFVLLACLILVLLTPTAVHAQEKLEALSSSAQVKFPMELTFSLSARGPVTISDIRLQYTFDRLSYAEVINETYIQFVPSDTVSVSWTLDMRQTGGLPPGVLVTYWWLLKDTAGNKIRTAPSKVTWDDNRNSWRKLVKDQITIYWYQGSNAFAEDLIDSAQLSLKRAIGDTGVRLVKPIKLYLYPSSQDLKNALVFPKGWEGAVAYTQHAIVMGGIAENNLTWGKQAITHEFSHLVIHQMVRNPYTGIPAWLSEGLASFTAREDRSAALQEGIRGNKLLSVRSLASPFSTDSETARISYAESDSIVDFLVRRYGQDKMVALLNEFRQGSKYDDALQKVYGFDMDGLDSQWRTYIK